MNCFVCTHCDFGLKVFKVFDNKKNFKATCNRCKSQLRFVLQIYAPGDYGEEGDDDESFHRTVYLFVCSSKNGCTGEATVVRQQLKEKNNYYPETAPDYEVRILSSVFDMNLLLHSLYIIYIFVCDELSATYTKWEHGTTSIHVF